MKNIKQKLNKVLVTGTVVAMSVPCFAAESGATAAMSTAMSSAKDEIMAMVALSLPIGLGLVGTFLAINKGIGFFQKLVNKAH